jgi:hypothetical protein
MRQLAEAVVDKEDKLVKTEEYIILMATIMPEAEAAEAVQEQQEAQEAEAAQERCAAEVLGQQGVQQQEAQVVEDVLGMVVTQLDIGTGQQVIQGATSDCQEEAMVVRQGLQQIHTGQQVVL